MTAHISYDNSLTEFRTLMKPPDCNASISAVTLEATD